MSHSRLASTSSRVFGVGIHSGKQTSLLLRPSAQIRTPGLGYLFKSKHYECPARYDQVTSTVLQTVLANRFETVEHLLACLWISRLHQVECVLGGTSREVPILDGSGLPFLELIEQTPKETTKHRVMALKVRKSVQVKDDMGGSARLDPVDGHCLVVDVSVQFGSHAWEHYRYDNSWCGGASSTEGFKQNVAPARTFAFLSQLARLEAVGLGKGGDASNCVIFDDATGKAVNTDLRFPDERVRHKVLDCIGDLSLCGYPLLAHFTGVKTGHTLNLAVVHELFADESNYELVELE